MKDDNQEAMAAYFVIGIIALFIGVWCVWSFGYAVLSLAGVCFLAVGVYVTDAAIGGKP